MSDMEAIVIVTLLFAMSATCAWGAWRLWKLREPYVPPRRTKDAK